MKSRLHECRKTILVNTMDREFLACVETSKLSVSG
jgi:hypothetical protein